MSTGLLQSRGGISSQESVVVKVPLQVMGLSVIYAAALNRLERRYPIKPDHIWAEVAGGVIISLFPIALEARREAVQDWRVYETALWLSFFASGTPIILWQLAESVMRQVELLRYTGGQKRRSQDEYADDTAPLALRSRGGEGSSDQRRRRDDDEPSQGTVVS